ncbi:helix-turn-helix domain-containing protein [Paenibacillus pabuli]|uniref:helix-turn-helix domain-containing protein n=1 Tax=Paenibacillus pabuli TaxID=1472 RepID=UPI000AE31FC3|nr:helix-turn-helix transcriptional regulator [Paenibacillus pabuli]
MEFSTKTIRSELYNYIKDNQIIISHFAERAGINPGTLSKIINGVIQVPVRTLDRITEAMNLEPGALYEIYIYECFNESSADWRRCKPLINRCAELNKLDCLDQLVGIVMDNLNYSPMLFDVAEILNNKNYHEAALIIYKKVAESERFQHAERLATCQYRIFKNSLTDNQEINLECAALFEPFIKRLGEAEQLDALKDLINLLMSLHRWDKAKSLAEEMGRIANNLYEQKYKKNHKNQKSTKPAKPLFGYILYSNLILGTISEEKNDFENALKYVSQYEVHDWIVETDDFAEATKKQFAEWAKANRYMYRLMSGEVSVLDEYVKYISSNENEILRALFKIVKAAEMYKINIDSILQRFEHVISNQIVENSHVGTYTTEIIADGLANFLADVGAYYTRKDEYSIGINYVLESLAISAKINNTACIVRCTCMVEKFRHFIDETSLKRYTTIMTIYEEVLT